MFHTNWGIFWKTLNVRGVFERGWEVGEGGLRYKAWALEHALEHKREVER